MYNVLDAICKNPKELSNFAKFWNCVVFMLQSVYLKTAKDKLN